MGRINESGKEGWKSYCSEECQYKSKTTSIILKCQRVGCNKKIRRAPAELSRNNGAYCSRTCAAIVNNVKYPNRHKLAIVKKCSYCGKDFTRRKKYCSVNCQHKGAVIGKEFILNQIKEFVKREGRIPMKREFYHYHAVRGRFGTWNNAIKAAGFEPNPVMFAKKYVAKDGHRCDSLAEKIIDDWLYKRHINHKRSFPYPGNRKFTADFVIKDYWVEFFGLHGELKRYDLLMKRKLRLVRKNKIKLIEIYPKDLFPKGHLEERLGFLLKG
ncbi:MAG TPA: hypothetical protein VF185_01490 [Patescibacteria group bacterium]